MQKGFQLLQQQVIMTGLCTGCGSARSRPWTKRNGPRWSTIFVRTEKGNNLIKVAEKEGFIKTERLEEQELITYTESYEMKKHSPYLEERRKYGWPTLNFYYPTNSAPIPRMGNQIERTISSYKPPNPTSPKPTHKSKILKTRREGSRK